MGEQLTAIQDRLRSLWTEALQIWSSGGWAMWPLAVTAFMLFAIGMHMHLRLREKRFLAVPERMWRRWIEHAGERTGPIGGLLEFLLGSGSVAEAANRAEELHAAESEPFERDLRVMRVCVSAAPLLGLLGTVTGMLSTFQALAEGSGGDQTMKLVASGISEALVTTMTGLVIALPGLFFQYRLDRKLERYKAFLAHVESVCTQVVFRRQFGDRRAKVREAAVAAIKESLACALAEEDVTS